MPSRLRAGASTNDRTFSKTCSFVRASSRQPPSRWAALPGFGSVVVPRPMRLPVMRKLSRPERSRLALVPVTLVAVPWLRTRFAELLLKTSEAPAPVMVFVRLRAAPTSPGVPTSNPFTPASVSTWPGAISVVCMPLVFPNCSEAATPPNPVSTTLSTFETAALPPRSKNLRSSTPLGTFPVVPAVMLVQLALVDQLFSPAPGPFQRFVSARVPSEEASHNVRSARGAKRFWAQRVLVRACMACVEPDHSSSPGHGSSDFVQAHLEFEQAAGGGIAQRAGGKQNSAGASVVVAAAPASSGPRDRATNAVSNSSSPSSGLMKNVAAPSR